MIGPQLIDLGNPVSDHPLNRDRVLWLYGLPNNSGSQQWYDLCGRNHGTLQGTPTTGSGWQPTARGDAGISLNPANENAQYVDCGTAAGAGIGSSDFTVAFWLTKRAMTVGYSNLWGVSRYYTGASAGTNEWSVAIGNGSTGTGDTAEFGVESGTTNYVARESVAMSLNTPYRIVATKSGTTLTLYRNGAMTAQNTSGPASINSVPARSLMVGNSSLHNLRPNAIFSDVTLVVGRAWSAADVTLDYDLSQRGSPGVLRRYTPRAWVVSGFDASTLLPPMLPTPPHPRQYKVASY